MLLRGQSKTKINFALQSDFTMKQLLLLLLISSQFSLNCFAQSISLHDLLQSNQHLFGNILEQQEQYDVQIIYTQINRDQHNYPSFKTYHYQVNPKKYFYPASTVKMPIAFLALEKLNQLNIMGLNKSSVMKTDSARSPQTIAHIDSSAANLSPSIEHYIKKIFLVSDNDAYNRLFEFLNVAYLNKRLEQKGYTNAHIIHRLGPSGASFNLEDNRYTNPIRFFHEDQLVYFQGESYSDVKPVKKLKKVFRGKGHYNNADEKVDLPFDFSFKNYIALEHLHDLLKSVIFPEAMHPHKRFELSEEDYAFLYQYMSGKPKESEFQEYKDKPDGYVKFLMYGGVEEDIPDHIRIFNKVGYAYGFLSDVAYIVDFESNVEFFLSAVIHVNENQIYNDNQYQYDEVGLPFLAQLGKIIYEYEKQRKKKHVPDLSKFKTSIRN